MAEQDNMQNGENSNRSTSGNGMHTWEMQGNGMSPMMMSRMQGGESEGANGASRQIRKMKERRLHD